ncbi:sigma-54-dependent transcriptional regulator [Desulfonema magnum]|uniref:Two component system response regulator, sigma54-specific n=1 Tax=Desulfonema magnum TaxID=45655 RepID=A0A975BR50_9BACT|nr:sigma-54 dependent transcriptional regulator [Desulfonema magnum]QTA90319.1 Two component system response regulator, sigma54-specific [Desulfonema magnum]
MNNTTDIKTSPKRLLIIDDEENMRHMLSVLLRKSGYIADTASDGHEGLQMTEKTQYDFILCDLKMPRMGGMAFLKSARDRLKSTTVIVMSAYGTIDTAIEAMKMGAYDYISKPFKTDEVYLALKKAEERENLRRENFQLKERIRKIEEKYKFGNMVAKSRAMKSVFKVVEKAAQYDSTVLVTGESGTGKELVAKGIHYEGTRAKMPFIPVNCGGVPESLLESEFFGYKKGAFTGADRNKKGLFEEAEGGTIFLDEVGEMPLPLQIKFLRVLQEQEIRPVGDSKIKKIDVRVIAATSKNLEAEVKKGLFRQDLFYRLNVLPVKLPPLRERTEDIPLLIQHFINRFNKKLDKNIKGVVPEVMAILLKHRWPGNVRELENIIERAFLLTEETMLSKENFPPDIGAASDKCISDSDHELSELFEGYSLKAAQKILEKKMITRALTATGGNRTKAGRLLEISHPSLLNKIKIYNIEI